MNNNIKRGIWVGAALLGWMGLVVSAQGASFDCGKVGTKVEHIICDNPEISKLDDELATAYKAVVHDKQRADAIRQAQKQWMKERNRCADAACVKNTYESRLHALSQGNESAKQVAATQPTQANAKVDTPTQSNVEEAACLAPKIDWRNYEWTLITGKGEAVCEEMLAYVKSRPKDIAPPTCPEERLPPNGNWTRPEVRIMSEEEKQALLRDIPERWRQKPNGPDYVQEIKSTQQLRVIRGDITRDGIPESLLAFGNQMDIPQACDRSKRCAKPDHRILETTIKGGISLISDSYEILPMDDVGTNVNWAHGTVGKPGPMNGELIYYKGLPYWMTKVNWSQGSHDNFTRWGPRTDYAYSAIFMLSEIGVGTGNAKKGDTPNFKDVTIITMQYDPESNDVCRFGYFHRDNLKQNPPKARR